MSIYKTDFEENLSDYAKEISKDWNESNPNDPMDSDMVHHYTELIRNWLSYYQGNMTFEELKSLNETED